MAGILTAGQRGDAAGHSVPGHCWIVSHRSWYNKVLILPDDLLLLVVDDEVPGLLQPHGGAGGPGEVQPPGPGTLIPPH